MSSRPLSVRRVVLVVGGVLSAAALAGAGVIFGPALVGAYQDSRPAERPEVPVTQPVTQEAQSAVEAAGGAIWSGQLIIGGRVVEEHLGIFDLGAECSHRYLRVSNNEPPESDEEYETVSSGGVVGYRMGDGEWKREKVDDTSSVPTYLELLSRGSACTFVEDFGRSTARFTPMPEVPGLPAPAEGATRYAGEMSVESLEQVDRRRTFDVLEKTYGRTVKRGEVPPAADYSGLAARLGYLVIDVDSSGAPVSLWLASKDPGSLLVEMTFSELASQSITLPEALQAN